MLGVLLVQQSFGLVLGWFGDAGDAASQPASQPANQPANQPTNQPANQPTNQPGLRGTRARKKQHTPSPKKSPTTKRSSPKKTKE